MARFSHSAVKIDRVAVYRQWRAYSHTVSHAKAAARNAYVIGHTRHGEHWVPVLSTDLGNEHEARKNFHGRLDNPKSTA